MEEHFNKADKVIEDIQKVTDRIKEVMAEVEKIKRFSNWPLQIEPNEPYYYDKRKTYYLVG